MTPTSHEVTKLLLAWSAGDQGALDRLVPLVYAELHRLAKSYMRKERAGQILQTTALIHEAYLLLIDARQVQWQNRAHFFGVAAHIMRQILVAMARERGARKRGGGVRRVSLDEELVVSQEQHEDLVAIDEALSALAEVDARKAQVVELGFFGGLTEEDRRRAQGLAGDGQARLAHRPLLVAPETERRAASMKRERWEEVERLYHAALEREPAARAAFLDKACAGDGDLRREVAGLLAYDDPEASFIKAPAIQIAARALATESPSESQSKAGTSPPGASQIGAYQLLELLGHGGMGEVHLASIRGYGAKSRSSCCPPSSPLSLSACAASRRKRKAQAH